MAKLSSSETPPLPLVYSSSNRQSSKKSMIAIEIGASDTSLSIMSVDRGGHGQTRAGGNGSVGLHFVEMNRQQQARREMPSPGYDRCIRVSLLVIHFFRELFFKLILKNPNHTFEMKKYQTSCILDLEYQR